MMARFRWAWFPIGISTLLGLAACGPSAPPPVFMSVPGDVPTLPPLRKPDSVFVLEWEPARRADLDAALRSGLTVVRYVDGILQVLGDCRLSEPYAHTPLPPEGGVQHGAGAMAGAEFHYTIIGRREVNRVALYRKELGRGCEGGTHFIRRALVGHFQRVSPTRDERLSSAFAGCDASTGNGLADSDCATVLRVDLHPITAAIMVRLTLMSFVVSEEKPNGRPWDALGEPPDPYFVFRRHPDIERATPVYKERLQGSPKFTLPDFELDDERPVTIEAADRDEPYTADDPMGFGTISVSGLRRSSGEIFAIELLSEGRHTAWLYFRVKAWEQ